MGFADYLSRNPSDKAPKPNTKDNNFVINTLDEITFNLIKIDLTPNGANVYNADTKQDNLNDVISYNQTHSDQNNAFSLNSHSFQSHPFQPHLLTPSKLNQRKSVYNSEIVAITTRNNPNKDKYSIPIQKRFRAPNKKPITPNGDG